MLRVAILGRPNVGKSTLYNRLVGKREAIVHDQPGVTRDRKYGQASIGGLDFAIIDTPGLEDLQRASLAGRMSAQSMAALDDADLILFVLDARAGVTTEDETFARHLRKTGLPVLLIANKAEAMSKVRDQLLEMHRLGFGDAVPFSAEHGDGMNALYDALSEYNTETEHTDADNIDTPITLAILGRPNVGKSTLINALLGEERVLTGPEAGMTRDTVTVALDWHGQPFQLVDTAGMRRKANINESLEKISVSATIQALKYAEVAVLMLDATAPLEKQDNTIAGLIEREGRACVIALNKADQITVDDAYLAALHRRLQDVVPQMKGIRVVPMVATEKHGTDALMQAVQETYDIWNTRIPTAQLNSWLHAIIEHHSPPLVGGRRLKFRYMTQTKARPPTFVLFANKSKEVPASYLRYLTNNLREAFELPGVPLRLLLRTGKNPYVSG